MKKVVLKLDLHDDKDKQKAMKRVSGLSGVDSVSMDMKEKKLTVVGDIDPVGVVAKLRKICHTDIVTVGPAKEPEKKKEEPKKEDAKKVEDAKKKVEELMKAYPYYQYPSVPIYQYGNGGYYTTQEENPNACVIC